MAQLFYPLCKIAKHQLIYSKWNFSPLSIGGIHFEAKGCIQILKVQSVNSAEPDQTLVLRCLPMSHKKVARLKWVNRRILDQTKRNAVKPALSDHFKGRPKLVFKTEYCLMQVKSIAECSKSILQYFRPPLSYHLSLRPLFCLFLSGHLRQVLLCFVREHKPHCNIAFQYSC